MISFLKTKIFLIGLLSIALLSAVFFSFYFKSSDRKPAQFSATELKYAEILLDEEEAVDDELIVAPTWEDSSNEDNEEEVLSMENKIESLLKKKYENDLIKELKKQRLQKAKAKRAEEFLRRAREDGYELTIDQDLNVIDVQEIPEKEKPLYTIPME